jgi:hypothetical protein
MKQNKIDNCSLHDIKIKEKSSNSITISMGEVCNHCIHKVECKNEIIDVITKNFIWINQVRVI